MGGSKTQVTENPAAKVQGPTTSPGAEQFQNLSLASAENAAPRINDFINRIAPLETQRSADAFAFTDPILRGSPLEGIFSGIGQGIDPGGAEQIIFDRESDRIQNRLTQLGLADSGVNAELQSQMSRDLAVDAVTRQREELKQLIELALGLGTNALDTAGNQVAGAGNFIAQNEAGRREFELSKANISRPTVANVQRFNPFQERLQSVTKPLADVGSFLGGASQAFGS